ncbi:uncharacterized protein LOC111223332 [Seriola dumerili]|uniref:Uncharacterized LOC111223332 n=1 Tax=Seriola dumerili TaxID=41447 RepID=A0A3B4T8V8_SERDU|nr:uncharacterized protein LOC111223332 [Seriola dumerili]
MNLWFSSLTLVAGLFLCSTALPLEECQTLVTPSSLADPSTMYGRLNVLVGYTDHEAFNGILKVTDSSWLKISPTSSPNKIVMSEDNKMNGQCFSSSVNITIDGNTATTDAYLPSIANITSVFHLVPSCDGCVVFSINTTASNLDHFFKLLNMTSTVTNDEIVVHSLYLMGKESTVKDSDMEHFKKQASCFGFDREPDFVYDTKKGFCVEGEGIHI